MHYNAASWTAQSQSVSPLPGAAPPPASSLPPPPTTPTLVTSSLPLPACWSPYAPHLFPAPALGFPQLAPSPPCTHHGVLLIPAPTAPWLATLCS